MTTASNEGDRIPMSQRERDRLRVLHSVLEGQRTQVEAARLLRLTPRHVRRLLQRLQQGGDAALIHGLRGHPSNHRKTAKLRRRVRREKIIWYYIGIKARPLYRARGAGDVSRNNGRHCSQFQRDCIQIGLAPVEDA